MSGSVLAASSVFPPVVRAGDRVRALWSGVAAPTSTDWVGVYPDPAAPDIAYMEWDYTSGAAAGSTVLTVPGTAVPGSTYEFRLFAEDGYTRLAGSGPFTVTGDSAVWAAESNVESGEAVTALWSGIATPTATDWIGLYPDGSTPDTAYLAWAYTSGKGGGKVSVTVPATAVPGGDHQLRLFAHDGYTRLAASGRLAVTTGATVAASPTVVAHASAVTAVWTGIATPTATDWIGVYRDHSAPDNEFLAWSYTAGAATGAKSLAVPGTDRPGSTYQLRLFANDGYTRLAASAPFTVTSGAVISVSPTITAGANVTASWSGVPTPTGSDWVGIYTDPAAPDSAYLNWVYTTGAASGAKFLTVPPTAVPGGMYQLRLFAEDGFTRLADAGPFTVTAGVEPADSLTEVRNDLTNDQYRAAFTTLFDRRRYRLVDLCGYEVAGQARFGGIWQRTSRDEPAQWTSHGIRAADYQGWVDKLRVDGFRPVRIDAYTVAGATFYNTIWHMGPGRSWGTRHNFNILNLSNHLRELRRDGFRLVDISLYASLEPNPDHPGPGPAPIVRVTRFASIWEESDGRDWQVSFPLSGDAHQQEFDRKIAAGYWPVRVSGSNTGDGSTQKFVALWEKAPGLPGASYHRIDPVFYDAESRRLRADGWRQTRIGGYSAGYGAGAVPRFNPLFEWRGAATVVGRLAAAYLHDYEVPGLSLAVAKDGRLAFATGYGVADTDTGEAVGAASTFRIASLSKPITAATVMKLASEGRLALNDLVFGPDGRLAALGTPQDARALRITVRHLLEHSGGGWPNDGEDPMFTNPALDARELVSWVLTHRDLKTAPGTRYAYSNFGYCVLARVIETVTGQPYDTYVRQQVLGPCGITGMTLAGNTKAQRQPGEVVYHDLDGDDPYGMQVTRMDAHGGWLASATDLLRFAVRVDGMPTRPDVLPADWIATMTRPSGLVESGGYGFGWGVDSAGTWWHTGLLPGSTSIMVRTRDGYCWAALANTRRRDPANPARDTLAGLDRLMWDVHDQVDSWPTASDL